MTLTAATTTTLGQSGPGSHVNEGSSTFPEAPVLVSPSDGLMWYPGHLGRGSYSFAKMQSAYSTASVNWAGWILND